MSIKFKLWRYLVLVAVVLSTSSTNAELLIVDGYVRGLPPGQPNTAAFMRLVNKGEQSITINRAESDSSELAEFHNHQHHNGLMKMMQVETITIAAGEDFILKPGAHHLMLLALTKPLRDGGQVSISLYSTDDESFTAVLPVRSVLKEHHHH